MSYEKKKLAGVLGNSHLGNYPYPPLPTSLMDQDHQDVYPMRMNPMQYPCNMQPPHPPPQPHPADQCLSTPQPPQTTEMVDDSCMVPVPQVVMDDHMTEPPDNLTMEDNYQNNENNITPANMDLPIQAEVVMEGPDNEDEQEQQDNDSNNLEKEKLPPKKHCFVCNTQLPQDIETAVPFFKTETTKTNKKFSAVVSKLVGRSITPRKAHSEIICRRCFNLLDRIDTLEVELKESKEEIVSNYKSTLEQYGGKTRRKRTVVSRKAAYLYRTTIAERTPRAAKKPKVVKQEVDPLTIQEVVGGAEAAAAVAAAATSEQSTSYAQSLIMDDNNMHHDDDDDDDDDDEDDDDDDDKKDSDNEPTTAGGKKRKRVRKFKVHHLSPLQRATAINLRKIGWTFIRIARHLKCSSSTAKRVCLRYDEVGSFEKKKRSKHHRVTTPEEDDALISLLQDYPSKTAKYIKMELGLVASEKTIKNRIKELRLKGIIPTPPPPPVKPKAPKPSNMVPHGIPGVCEDENAKREYPKMLKKQPKINKRFIKKQQYTPPPPAEMPAPEVPFYPGPHTAHTSNIYKDMRNDSFKINNESHFQREANKPMPYYNQNMGMSPFYQHFFH